MKNKVLVLTSMMLLSTVGFGSSVNAATASTATSDGKISFIAGDDEVTPPVGPTDPVDPGNPGTGNKGPLSIDYVSNIKFGEHKISGKNTIYSALNEKPYVQVTDLRGSGAGWNLTAKASEFKSADGTKVLKGAELSFKNAQVQAGSAENVSSAPVATDLTFNNKDSQPVLNAEKDSGKGTWLNLWSGNAQKNDNVQLKVLAGTADANTEYTATITWELLDAPK